MAGEFWHPITDLGVMLPVLGYAAVLGRYSVRRGGLVVATIAGRADESRPESPAQR